MISTELPERLKELRKSKGLTQKELALETGLSIASIISYENGLREPNFKALTVFEEYFGVSGEYLNGTITTEKYLEYQNDVQSDLDSITSSMIDFKNMMKTLDSEEQLYVTELFDMILSHISTKQDIDFEKHSELSLFNAYKSLNKVGKMELVNRGI